MTRGFFIGAIGIFRGAEKLTSKGDRALRGYRSVIAQVEQICGPRVAVIVSCADCGVEVLTVPANRRRKDVRCPFRCRQLRKRDRGQKRERKHNQSPKGKSAKKLRNRKRYLKPPPQDRSVPIVDLTQACSGSLIGGPVLQSLGSSNQIKIQDSSFKSPTQYEWDPALIKYLCWIVSEVLNQPVTTIQIKSQLNKLLWRFSSQRSLRGRGG